LIRDTWPFVRFVRASGRCQVDTRTTGGGGRKWYDTQEQALEAARVASEQKKEFGTASHRNDELTVCELTVADAIKFALEHLRKKSRALTFCGIRSDPTGWQYGRTEQSSPST